MAPLVAACSSGLGSLYARQCVLPFGQSACRSDRLVVLRGGRNVASEVLPKHGADAHWRRAGASVATGCLRRESSSHRMEATAPSKSGVWGWAVGGRAHPGLERAVHLDGRGEPR